MYLNLVYKNGIRQPYGSQPQGEVEIKYGHSASTGVTAWAKALDASKKFSLENARLLSIVDNKVILVGTESIGDTEFKQEWILEWK